MREATLYEKLPEGKVKCTACKQACIIADKHTGVCGVRQNIDGKLYLLVYGKASAVNVDPVEKKPLFHFLPATAIFSLGTVGCNLSCQFCQNWDLSQSTKELKMKLLKEKKPELMGIEIDKFGYELSPEQIIEICKRDKIKSIAYTYNEPIIFFEYLYDTARLASKEGIKNVLVSNGYETDVALEKLKPYIHAMNIDLKGFTEEFYQKICGAKLSNVLETIKHAHKLGIWIEITTLVISGQNDTDDELKNIAEFICSVDKNMPWHVTAFHPDYKMTSTKSTPHKTLIRAHDIGKKAGLNFVYVGNVIDNERSNTYCPKCNALLISRRWHDVKIENINLADGKCKNCSEKIKGVWN